MKKLSKFETWLYNDVFNNEKISIRHYLCSIYWRFKRRVKIIKSWSIFFKFWKLPAYIDNFSSAVGFAKLEIEDLREVIKRKDDQVDTLIVALIEEYTRNQMSPEEAHREAYQMAFYHEDQWYRHLPNKYQTEKEIDQIFDDDLDAYLTRDPIGDAGYQELMNFELSQLKKGGIYETSY